MAAETLAYQNVVVSNGDFGANSIAAKKSRESERRRSRRRLKQKKNKNKASEGYTDPQQDTDKKDESEENTTTNKKAGSDSEEEENDNDQKEKGVSNKKTKLQRRMKIAELKQICSRPYVVEFGIFCVAWDATSADPNMLVFLKSY